MSKMDMETTVAQLLETTQQFAGILDSWGQADVIVIDFCKPFNKVTHSKLVENSVDTVVDESLVSWIKAYLSNRSQYVDIEGNQYTIQPVTSGAPQRPVLGPTLFLVYINGITKDIDTSVELRLFAHDYLIRTRLFP